MPVLVSNFAQQPADFLTTLRVLRIAELAPMRAQPVTQLSLLGRHRAVRFVLVHSQSLQCIAGAVLCVDASLLDSCLELSTQSCGKWCHG